MREVCPACCAAVELAAEMHEWDSKDWRSDQSSLEAVLHIMVRDGKRDWHHLPDCPNQERRP